MVIRKSYLDNFLVYLLLFVSGSHLYQQSSNFFLMVTSIVSVIAWLLTTDRKINILFVNYTIGFTSFLLLIHFYTGGSLPITSVLGTTVELVMAYLIIKTVGQRFVPTYINVVVFLAVISLFGYFSDSFRLFNGVVTKLYQVGELGYEGIFYLYRFKEQIDRNNSIFFEPGAYQVFLNVALFMLFFTKTGFTVKRQWVYIIILLVTLLSTFSTTGFLMFAVTFGLVLLKSAVLSTKGKITLVAMILLIGASFSSQLQHVVLFKLKDYLETPDMRDQTNLRTFDVLVDIEIIKRNIFGLGYREYLKAVSEIGKKKLGQTSSNGVTASLAIYGLPFTLFLFSSYYVAFRKLVGPGIMSFGAFLMFLMFLVGESYYLMVPYTLSIIAAAFVYTKKPEEPMVEVTRPV